MREYLKTHYADTLPERFARRCLGALFYSYQMGELWEYFIEDASKTDEIIPDIQEYFFPADVFGLSD
jgi:hypothetical protein